VLGACTPPTELGRVATRTRGEAIVLYGHTADESQALSEQLARLRADSGVPIFVGGSASVGQRDVCKAAGAIPLGHDIANGVKCLTAALVNPQRIAAAESP